MAAALAHELNQPLTAAVSAVQAARRTLASASPEGFDGQPPEVREAMDLAAEQARRAGQIVRRLRDFVARGEADPRLESLPALVEEAAALALVGAKERRVEVALRVEPGLPPVLADRIQVQQVLFNLMRNALEAMHDGEAPASGGGKAPRRRELVVAAGPAASGEGRGCGGRHRPGLGAGGGRAAVRAFRFDQGGRHGRGPVDLPLDRGGTWRAALGRIEPEGGTVFRFTLPAARSSEAGAGQGIKRSSAVTEANRRSRRSCPERRAGAVPTPGRQAAQSTSSMTMKRSAGRSRCCSGRQASRWRRTRPVPLSSKRFPTLREDTIGCVVTDVRMPGPDGLDVAAPLKQGGFLRPVVVMTAHGDVSMAVRAMKAGAVDFVEKPFDDEALLAATEAALRTPHVAGAAGADDAAERMAALSPREREVLGLLVAGKPNKLIARDLGLSPRTVEVHRARLMARLRVGSLAEAVRLAVHAELGQHAGTIAPRPD